MFWLRNKLNFRYAILTKGLTLHTGYLFMQKKLKEHYQSVKHIGPRAGPKFCDA